jgi:hypothetical protein
MPRTTWSAIALASALALAPGNARADAVADWSRIALTSVLESRQSTPDALNTLATVHAAMFETLNFIEARYTPRYVAIQSSAVTMLGDAAAAAAAQYVLVEAYPDRRTMLDQALHASLAPIEGDATGSTSKILGRSLAAVVWALRTRTSTPPKQDPPAIDLPAWNGIVDLTARKNLQAIEQARIYALVSIAADEAMTAALKSVSNRARPCTSCAVHAAVDTVLRLELGAGSAVQRSPSPAPLIFRDAAPVVQVNFVGGADDPIVAGKQLGARIGSYVSRSFYKLRNE